MTESSTNPGIFEADLKFVDPSTASPSSNEIKVANGGIVTLVDPNFSDPDGTGTLNPILVTVERRDYVTGALQTFDNVTGTLISNLVK
ncbi:hypothetical protein D3C85_1742880 [compost metagenome]